MPSYYVRSTTGSDGSSGTSWDTALATIDKAISFCYENDSVIYVSQAHIEPLNKTLTRWDGYQNYNTLRILVVDDSSGVPPTALSTTKVYIETWRDFYNAYLYGFKIVTSGDVEVCVFHNCEWLVNGSSCSFKETEWYTSSLYNVGSYYNHFYSHSRSTLIDCYFSRKLTLTGDEAGLYCFTDNSGVISGIEHSVLCSYFNEISSSKTGLYQEDTQVSGTLSLGNHSFYFLTSTENNFPTTPGGSYTWAGNSGGTTRYSSQLRYSPRKGIFCPTGQSVNSISFFSTCFLTAESHAVHIAATYSINSRPTTYSGTYPRNIVFSGDINGTDWILVDLENTTQKTLTVQLLSDSSVTYKKSDVYIEVFYPDSASANTYSMVSSREYLGSSTTLSSGDGLYAWDHYSSSASSYSISVTFTNTALGSAFLRIVFGACDPKLVASPKVIIS